MRSGARTTAISGVALAFLAGAANVGPPPGGGHDVVRIVASGSTRGEIAECGCLSGPQGGLARRTAFLDSLRRQGDFVLVDAGDFASTDSVSGALVTDSLAAYLARTGYDAVAVGDGELLRPEVLNGPLRSKLVAANLFYANGTPATEAPYRLIRVGRRTVGVTALLDSALVAGLPAPVPFVVRAPATVLPEVAARMRAEGATLVVLLAHMSQERAKELGRLGLADLVVIGHETSVRAGPRTSEGTTLVWPGDRGRYLAEAELEMEGDEPVSVAGRTHPLMENLPRDESVARWVERLKAARKRLERERLMARSRAASAPEPDAAACASCHEAEHAQWLLTSHAHAYETLEAYDMGDAEECLRCHATSITGAAFERGVACLACHEVPRTHPHAGSPATSHLSGCTACHDAINSPGFDAPSAWARIRHRASR